VIAFEIQSASEIVVHGETGFLVPKANIPELARRVEQLASDTELCQRMGSEGRKRVEELFEFTRGVEKVENLIR
jgi:glycosyltransferase involved in cell wall biosynthesis